MPQKPPQGGFCFFIAIKFYKSSIFLNEHFGPNGPRRERPWHTGTRGMLVLSTSVTAPRSIPALRNRNISSSSAMSGWCGLVWSACRRSLSSLTHLSRRKTSAATLSGRKVGCFTEIRKTKRTGCMHPVRLFI